MALHPENIHTGLSKITQFCEESIDKEEFEESENGYWRDFIYIPILLINDDLYELHNNGTEYGLHKVESSMLVYNYHYKNKSEMAYVYVVTKSGLSNLLEYLLEIEEKIETEMIELRMKNVI